MSANISGTLTSHEKDDLIELSYGGCLKMEVTKLEFSEFWIKTKNEYPSVSRKQWLFFYFIYNNSSVRLVSVQCSTRYKNKFRYKLDVNLNLRLKSSLTEFYSLKFFPHEYYGFYNFGNFFFINK